MRKPVFVVIVLALVSMCGTIAAEQGAATAAPATSDASLPDGFRVATGTRLLGAAVPTLPVSSDSDSPGWTAYLWVDTDAASALNAYARQSRVMGLREDPNHPASCSQTRAPAGLVARGLAFNPPEPAAATSAVNCQADFFRPDLGISITVWVCRSCSAPTAEARLAVTHGPQGPWTDRAGYLAATRPIAPLPPETPTAKLTARERAQARRATPTTGERFSNDVAVIELPRVAPGSEALAPALAFPCGNGDIQAVLRLRANTRTVLDALLNQSDEPATFKPKPDGVVDGVAVTHYRYAYYTSLDVVEDPHQRQPIAVFERCDD
jgi:hypothetical protein